jgi:hypothetical protein
MQSPLVNSKQPQDLQGFIDDLLTLDITFQVIAVADVSPRYHHAVHAGAEGIEYEAMIHPSGTHEPDQPHIGWVLHTRHTRQVGTRIGAPVTHEG